jgi:proteasome assembly chaperone (PAC2) family protein
MKDIFRFSQPPKLENPSLIVGWDKDAGQLSSKVIKYLNEKINGRSFCEIEPVDFFSLAGVTIDADVAQFPRGKFYCGERKDIVIFKGSEPEFERYRFLERLSNLARCCLQVKHLYTISGTISSIAHTKTRKIWAVFNQHQFQKESRGLGLKDMTWQGTPAINSYLLWIAERKGIAGVSLWTQIPFYLAAGQDFQAAKRTLCFLNKRFNLELDFKNLDEQIQSQNDKINRLRQEDSEIDRCIEVLENGHSLNEAEQLELIKAVSEFLEYGKSPI